MRSSITPRQHAIILQNRCKAAIGGAVGSHGKVVIGALKQLEKNWYYFDISEEDEFEFRGRVRKETLWSATVHVKPDHEVDIQELDAFGDMPQGVLRCISAPISGSDYSFLHK
jgi:hypothetical protein